MSRGATAALVSLLAVVLAGLGAAESGAADPDLAARAAAAAGRPTVHGAARGARRPQVLGAEPRPADGRRQQHDPARHLQLERPRLAPAGDRLRRPGRQRRGSPGRARTEFWVVSEPSLPRAGSGLALCRFKDGQVGRLLEHPDRRRRPLPADALRRLQRTERLLVRRGRLPGRAGRAGRRLPSALGRRRPETVYGPQGRGVTDMQFHAGTLFESTAVGRSPESRSEPVELASPEPTPRLLHTRRRPRLRERSRSLPAPLPDVPADGTELLGARQRRHRPLGGRRRRRLRALGAGRKARSRGRRWRLAWSAAPSRSCRCPDPSLRPERSPQRRRGDAGQRSRDGDRGAVRRPSQRQQQGDRGPDRARRPDRDHPPAGLRRRARQRRPDRLSRRRRMLDGDLGRLALPLHRRHRRCRSTPTPTSRARSTSAPTRRPNSSSPTRCRKTTRSCSPRPRSKSKKKSPRPAPAACRRC